VSSINFFFEDIPQFSIDIKSLKKHINKLIINELKMSGDLSIIFCSDNYLLGMNKQYLNHNYYTDIITFDYVEENVISGDLFISIDLVKENAVQFKNELMKEIYRVVFHGVLHLIGYKDKTSMEKTLMTNKENYYLSQVDFSGVNYDTKL
jgi:rRNA maturation RNase YbeY